MSLGHNISLHMTFALACSCLWLHSTASPQVLDPHTLRFRWRFDATLRSPIRLKFKPYTGTTLYRTNADGLIAEHLETWCVAFLHELLAELGTQELYTETRRD